jgi:hypothetical protein
LVLGHLVLLERIVILWRHPEVGYEFFEVLGVSISDVLEEKLVLVLRVHVAQAVVHAVIHVVVHVAIHVAIHVTIHVVVFDSVVAIEYTGQGLVGEGIHVHVATVGVVLVVAVGVVHVNYVHHYVKYGEVRRFFRNVI